MGMQYSFAVNTDMSYSRVISSEHANKISAGVDPCHFVHVCKPKTHVELVLKYDISETCTSCVCMYGTCYTFDFHVFHRSTFALTGRKPLD